MTLLKLYVVLLLSVIIFADAQDIFKASSKSHDLSITSIPDNTVIVKNAAPVVTNAGSITVDKLPEVILTEVQTKAGGTFTATNPKLSVEGDFSPYIGGKKKRSNNVITNKTIPGDTRYHVTHKKYKLKKVVLKEKIHSNVNEPPPTPDTPIELGAEEEESDTELGSAFEDDDKMNKIEGKKKPCQKPSCSSSNENDDNDGEENEPAQPDIPVELGSAIREDDENGNDNNDAGITKGKDQVVYIPFRTPRHFVVVDNDAENDEGDDGSNDEVVSGSGSDDVSGNERKRSIGDSDIILQQNYSLPFSVNTDGDYDGELLHNFQKQNVIEADSQNQVADEHVQRRKRRSVKTKKIKKQSSRRKRKKPITLLQHRNSKRSDIEADRELLKTIENLNTIASKRAIPSKSEKKPIKGYIKHLAHDVRGVLDEAKTALKDTGRVIRGLRRVISGTSVLNSFTNNAVKFAKYFSMEPNNATIDYLEEKAIVSVLDAQRAANGAKEAAKLAQLAYAKTQEVEKRMEVASKGHKNVQKGLSYVHAAKKQAGRAEKAAKLASSYKEKTEKDVMLMDLELRKMGAQLEAQNNVDAFPSVKNGTTSKSTNEKVKISAKNQSTDKTQSPVEGTEESSETPEDLSETAQQEPISYAQAQQASNSSSQVQKVSISSAQAQPTPASSVTQVNSMYTDTEESPDVQLLLPKVLKEKKDEKLLNVPKDADNTTKKHDADYFYMKQKQLEKQLGNDTTIAKRRKLTGKKHTVPVTNSIRIPATNGVRMIDMIPPTGTEEVKHADDQVELQYIASLNKKIATIKKEEEEATQRLRAVELARTFAVTKNHPVEDFDNAEVAGERASIRTVSDLASELSHSAPSLLKTNVPVATDQYASAVHHKTPTHETAIPNTAISAKKRTKIHRKKVTSPHIFPGEYTGFKKHKIAVVEDIQKDETHHHPSHENSEESLKNVAKSQVLSPKYHAQPITQENVGDALSDDENTVVAEDHDNKRKRERMASEEKFKNNMPKDDDDNDADNDESGSGEESGDTGVNVSSKRSQVSLIKKIKHSSVSVVVTSNKKKSRKRNEIGFKKIEDLIDPFGFNRIQNTNEGNIADRTVIPRPLYLTPNYKRSEVPEPKEINSEYTQVDVISDNKK